MRTKYSGFTGSLSLSLPLSLSLQCLVLYWICSNSIAFTASIILRNPGVRRKLGFPEKVVRIEDLQAKMDPDTSGIQAFKDSESSPGARARACVCVCEREREREL